MLRQNTIVDRLHVCREICMTYFERNLIAIGGNSLLVDVYEALLVNRKFHDGDVLMKMDICSHRN